MNFVHTTADNGQSTIKKWRLCVKSPNLFPFPDVDSTSYYKNVIVSGTSDFNKLLALLKQLSDDDKTITVSADIKNNGGGACGITLLTKQSGLLYILQASRATAYETRISSTYSAKQLYNSLGSNEFHGVYYYFGSNAGDRYIKNVQIEIGDTATKFLPYGPAYFKLKTRVPVEYREVPYLESTGTQWIDTEYMYNSGDIVKLVLKITTSQYDTAFFGCYTTNAFELGKLGNSIRLNVSGLISGISTDEILTATLDSAGRWSVNGITAQQNSSISRTVSAILFGRRYNGNIDKKGDCQIYRFNVIRNNVVICDFIPCCRCSDSKPGMYDIVNNKFYINQGSNEFIIGTND